MYGSSVLCLSGLVGSDLLRFAAQDCSIQIQLRVKEERVEKTLLDLYRPNYSNQVSQHAMKLQNSPRRRILDNG